MFKRVKRFFWLRKVRHLARKMKWCPPGSPENSDAAILARVRANPPVAGRFGGSDWAKDFTVVPFKE